jgi:23S rRNA (cytidine1920-2'-O)/16S rRNA (cytidine1409-2'-O)-methyltransferase
MEGVNARHLTRDDLPAPVDLVTIDVSFISLRLILPVVPPLLAPGADVVALVKPQFEAGRAEARKGIVRDSAIHARVVDEVVSAATEVGLTRVGSTPSPITGQKGNVEILLHLRPS